MSIYSNLILSEQLFKWVSTEDQPFSRLYKYSIIVLCMTTIIIVEGHMEKLHHRCWIYGKYKYKGSNNSYIRPCIHHWWKMINIFQYLQYGNKFQYKLVHTLPKNNRDHIQYHLTIFMLLTSLYYHKRFTFSMLIKL